jgi:hypothetical protein
VCVTGRPPREARPERVAQRTAGQREAERVVLVNRIGDEAEAAPRVEQAEGWRARERMAWVCAHRRCGGLRVRDSDVDGSSRRSYHSSRHHLDRRGLGSREGERGLGCPAAAAASRNAAYAAAAAASVAITSTNQADLIRHHVASID